jgi:hypothetical protein
VADTPEQPTPKPEPVLAAFLVATLSAVLAAVGFNLSDELVGQIATLAAGAIVTAVSAWVARSRVTPVANPAAADGTPLVPVGTAPAAAPADPLLAQVLEQLRPPANGADVTTTFDDVEVERLVAPAPAAPLPPVPVQRPPQVGLLPGETVGNVGHQAEDVH